jgi:hypothetical protein
MITKFSRGASKWSYYSYLQRTSPEHLRKHQSERNYYLGRKGAFDTLVYKMAADHICYEEDFNMRYKVPTFVVNTSMRVCWYWFVIPSILISFYLGDMIKTFNPTDVSYLKRPLQDGEIPTRYESMYMHDKQARF